MAGQNAGRCAATQRVSLPSREHACISLHSMLTCAVVQQRFLPKAASAFPDFDMLMGGRRLFGMLFSMQVESLVSGFGTMILVLLFYLLVRREWLAVAGVWLLLTTMRLLGDNVGSLAQVFSVALGMSLFIFVLMRYGLLAGVASQFFIWLWNYPLTADFTTWYAGSGIFAIIIGAGLAFYGFYTSIARRSFALGDSRLPDV